MYIIIIQYLMRTFILLLSFLTATFVIGQSNWSSPINVGTSSPDDNPSLEIVNGFPAICFQNFDKDIIYVRALDACGDTWGPAINISDLYLPNINSFGAPDMIIVDGHPAICFEDNTNLTFVYCRADDLDGTSWTQFKIVDSGSEVGRQCEMHIVNGVPAIAYNDERSLCKGLIKYVTAADTQGSVWNSPITLAGGQCSNGVNNIVNLQILNGHPAVSMYQRPSAGSGISKGVYFLRAHDTSGTVWPDPSLVYVDGANRGFVVVDNKPHVLVGFTDSATNMDSLGIAVSTDSLGNSWSGNLQGIDFDGSDMDNGRIHDFDNKIWVTGVYGGNSVDTLAVVSSPHASPLVFGPQDIINRIVTFLGPHDFISTCGQLASVFKNSDFWYTRTETVITYYLDSDSDGYGDSNVSMDSIAPPVGYVDNDLDCDDSDPNITHPGTPCDDGIICTSGTTLQPDCVCGNPTMVNTSINIFVGVSDLWMDASNWSLNAIPEICHDIVIPTNKTVRILNGEVGTCFSIDVHESATLETETGGELYVVTLGN